MELQYLSKRMDAEYTRGLWPDPVFFGEMINLDIPELQKVRTAVRERDFVRARAEYINYLKTSGGKRYYFGVNDLSGLSAAIRTYYEASEIAPVIEEADRICEGDIPLQNGKRVKFPGNHYIWNDWLYDSSQYQLRLTRFPYITYLSRAYCITGNEKYASCLNNMLSHFIDDNPIPKDDTFNGEHCTWDALNAGLRPIYWAEALVTCFNSKALADEVKIKIIKSLYDHGVYLRKYYTTFGNHAIMELHGMLVIALLFPEFKDSSEWMTYGISAFEKQIMENVYKDGVQFEGSPTYHIVVMNELFKILLLLRKNSYNVSGLSGILEKMYEVLMHIQTPDHEVPCFGDTHKNTSIKSMMSLGAAIFNRGDFKYLGYGKFPLEYIWMFGSEILENYNALKPEIPIETSVCFPVGGYMVSRKAWEESSDYIIMKAGVGINGHTHADALSIILYSKGRELICDAGIGIYQWIPERKHILSTKAHNTVVVDGQDQHVRSMHWNPPESAPCKIWDFRSNDRFDYFFASHYGYTRFEDPVIHSRKVLYIKRGYWLIVDILNAKKSHAYDLYYQMGENDIKIGSGLNKIVRLGEPNLLLTRPDNKNTRTSVEQGLIYSYTKNQFVESHSLRYSQHLAGTAVFETVLIQFDENEPDIKIERAEVLMNGRLLEPYEATCLKISYDGKTDTICMNHLSADVEGYLDHTGNIINDKLLTYAVDKMQYDACGKTYTNDVVLD